MEGVPIKGTITVGSTGVVRVPPDTARLSVGISARSRSVTTARDQVANDAQGLLDALADAGVQRADTTTAMIDVRPVSERDEHGNYRETGDHVVSTVLTVVIRDIAAVGRIIDTAIACGGAVHGVNFYVDDSDRVAAEARALAVERARTSAEGIAAAAGLVVTGVYAIIEGDSPTFAGRNYGGLALAEARLEMPVEPGETSVDVSITAIFETAPTRP